MHQLECIKFVFRRGAVADPAGGAHDAPPGSLVSWRGRLTLSSGGRTCSKDLGKIDAPE